MEGRLSPRDGSVRRSLGRFCEHQGQDGTLRAQLVEAFVVGGLPGRAASTRGTYRSVLRHMTGAKPALAKPFSGSPAKAPYSAPERAELLSVAASQRSEQRRSSALALLALGIGAGLRAGELAAAAGDDVMSERGRVKVRVGAGRVVPVAGVYGETLARQAKRAGPGHLFCPGGADRAYKNFVNNFCYSLEC